MVIGSVDNNTTLKRKLERQQKDIELAAGRRRKKKG